MKDEEIKVRIKGRTMKLEELFDGKKETRKKMAGLSFERKISMLKSLQKTAYSWGNLKDVVVWK